VTKRATTARAIEGDGNNGKSDDDEGGGRAMATRAMATAMVTMWAMAMARRLVGNKEAKGKYGKGNADGNEGGGQQRGQG
jgi:hypothetical protein